MFSSKWREAGKGATAPSVSRPSSAAAGAADTPRLLIDSRGFAHDPNDAARAAAARAAQQRAAQEAARAAAQKAAQDAVKTTADPASTEGKQPALSPTQVQATADVQQARGEKAAATIGAVDAKKPATTTASSTASATSPLYAAEPAPLSTSTKLTEATSKALAPEASVDDRKKAAEQFTEGLSLGNLFGGRDTTVSGDDVKNAQTLHQAEALRSDANPEVKAKLESEMLKGLEQAPSSREVPHLQMSIDGVDVRIFIEP